MVDILRLPPILCNISENGVVKIQTAERISIQNSNKNSIYFFCGPFMFLFCLVFAVSLCLSVYMCLVVTCWERADLLALVCGVCCEFLTFPLVSWVRCGT